MLKKIGIGVLAVVALVVLVGLVLPKDYRVERSVVVAAAPEKVFAQVNSLRNWQPWSPWIAKDKTIKNTYEGPEAGVGAKVSWTSEDSGNGTQEIVESSANQSIRMQLDFGEMGVAQSYWQFKSEGAGTHVLWGMEGESSGVVGGYLSLMMDSFVGPDYEDGLARLQRHVE